MRVRWGKCSSGLVGATLAVVACGALADPVTLPQVQSSAAMLALPVAGAAKVSYVFRSDLGVVFSLSGSNCAATDTYHVQPTLGTGCWTGVSNIVAKLSGITGGTTNNLLYDNAGVLDSLATGNNGTLITSANGVPSISSTLPSAVQGNITALGAVTSGSLSGLTGINSTPIGATTPSTLAATTGTFSSSIQDTTATGTGSPPFGLGAYWAFSLSEAYTPGASTFFGAFGVTDTMTTGANGDRQAFTATLQSGVGILGKDMVAAQFFAHNTGGDGTWFGDNPVCEIDAGSTSTSSCAGGEADTDVRTAATAKVGWQIADLSTSSGSISLTSAGLIIGGQTGASGYKNGIQFGYNAGILGVTGNLITTLSSSQNLTSLVDFSPLSGTISTAGIILPANINELYFGASGGGGKIVSTATSGAPTLTFANDFMTENGLVFAATGNLNGAYPSGISTNGSALTWNFTAGGAEADIWNLNTTTTDTLRVYQLTGASAATLVLDISSTGLIQTGSGAFTANGAVATAMSSVGPIGSHTTVQEWFTVKDSAGTTRYIPAF